jgi:hypothetical protein
VDGIAEAFMCLAQWKKLEEEEEEEEEDFHSMKLLARCKIG